MREAIEVRCRPRGGAPRDLEPPGTRTATLSRLGRPIRVISPGSCRPLCSGLGPWGKRGQKRGRGVGNAGKAGAISSADRRQIPGPVSGLAAQPFQGPAEGRAGLERPGHLQGPLARLGAQNPLEAPVLAIPLEGQPPGAPLELQADRLLSQKLVHQALVLADQVGHRRRQGPGLGRRELSRPALATDQHRERLAILPPGQSPALPFQLDHARPTAKGRDQPPCRQTPMRRKGPKPLGAAVGGPPRNAINPVGVLPCLSRPADRAGPVRHSVQRSPAARA